MVTGAGDAFSSIVAGLDYPMLVVTVASPAGRSGCLVGFSTQSSIDPPRFLICLSDKNHTYRVANAGATRLAVHLLGAGQEELAKLFGEETGDDVDKFARCGWQEGPDGVPVLDDAAAWFSGPILERHRTGDHVAYLIEIDAAEHRDRSATYLDFQAVRDMEPGHEA